MTGVLSSFKRTECVLVFSLSQRSLALACVRSAYRIVVRQCVDVQFPCVGGENLSSSFIENYNMNLEFYGVFLMGLSELSY